MQWAGVYKLYKNDIARTSYFTDVLTNLLSLSTLLQSPIWILYSTTPVSLKCWVTNDKNHVSDYINVLWQQFLLWLIIASDCDIYGL